MYSGLWSICLAVCRLLVAPISLSPKAMRYPKESTNFYWKLNKCNDINFKGKFKCIYLQRMLNNFKVYNLPLHYRYFHFLLRSVFNYYHLFYDFISISISPFATFYCYFQLNWALFSRELLHKLFTLHLRRLVDWVAGKSIKSGENI